MAPSFRKSFQPPCLTQLDSLPTAVPLLGPQDLGGESGLVFISGLTYLSHLTPFPCLVSLDPPYSLVSDLHLGAVRLVDERLGHQIPSL